MKRRNIDYENLFELWADFDDSESSEKATAIIEEKGLGPVDAVSFLAFCFGYEKTMEERET
jgi:hypothetical protein